MAMENKPALMDWVLESVKKEPGISSHKMRASHGLAGGNPDQISLVLLQMTQLRMLRRQKGTNGVNKHRIFYYWLADDPCGPVQLSLDCPPPTQEPTPKKPLNPRKIAAMVCELRGEMSSDPVYRKACADCAEAIRQALAWLG